MTYENKRGPETEYRGILYIEPKHAPSVAPVMDELTEKMMYAIRFPFKTGMLSGSRFIVNSAYRGWHECTCGCGAKSTNVDYVVSQSPFPFHVVTNSLAPYYLMHHRDEIPKQELEIIEKMDGNPISRWY
jgi:hypothetical protein